MPTDGWDELRGLQALRNCGCRIQALHGYERGRHAATTTAMSNERLMLNGTFGSIGSVPNLSTTRDALLAVRDVASGNNWECHTDAVAGVCLSRRGGRCARCGVRE
jgi:hypothetical protein